MEYIHVDTNKNTKQLAQIVRNNHHVSSEYFGFQLPQPFALLLLSLKYLCKLSIFINCTLLLGEGSFSLHQNAKGHRMYLMAGNSSRQVFTDASLPRNTVFKVWVKPGETLLLASSAVGIGEGKILVERPNGFRQVFSSELGQRIGNIRSLEEEKAGPFGLFKKGEEGYRPFRIMVEDEGIWTVKFIPPDPNSDRGECPKHKVSEPWIQGDNWYIAAWDISVLGENDVKSGRVFCTYLPLKTGKSQTANPSLFILTDTHHLFSWSIHSIVADEFLLFINNHGIKGSTKVQGFSRDLGIGVSDLLHHPLGPNEKSWNTYKMFFQPPDPLVFYAKEGQSVHLVQKHELEDIFLAAKNETNYMLDGAFTEDLHSLFNGLLSIHLFFPMIDIREGAESQSLFLWENNGTRVFPIDMSFPTYQVNSKGRMWVPMAKVFLLPEKGKE